MATLLIARQNVPSFKEWKAGSSRAAVDKCRELGAVKGVWIPDKLNNLPAVRALIKVPAEKRTAFMTSWVAPSGPPVQMEEYLIDQEVGLGGENKLTGAAMMMCKVTLACPYEDFKVNFIESILGIYPGCCKAYLCKLEEANENARAFYVVFFDAASLTNVKLAHDLTKPTPFRQLIDDGLVKEVEVYEEEIEIDVLGYGMSQTSSQTKPPKKMRFDWVPEVSVSFDENNKGGAQSKVEIFGRINGELMAKLEAACEYLAKHQHTFSYTLKHLIESDLELVVREKCGALPGKAKDHLRLHAGGPLVLLNSAYLGSIREFETWANKTYGYLDKTMDALYARRARQNLARYMEQEKDIKDFVFMDMAFLAADGTAEAIKPRIVVELYKKTMPKAAFNMVTLCEDKLAGSQVHRVVSKGWVQMGGGLGDASVYGGTFEDESFSIKHSGAGDVGMASTGPHSNGCQFYISLDKLEWLDGQKMIIGRVVDGLKAVKAMGRAEVAPWNQVTYYLLPIT